MNLYSNIVGLVFLVAPALWVLFRTIEPYEKQLIERKLYLGFLGGAVLSSVAFAIEWLGRMRIGEGDQTIVGQPVIHIMIMVMALNHPRMRKHKENGFYGAALGLSFGATHGLLFLLAKGPNWLQPLDIVLLVPALFGLTLFLGSVGAYIGNNTYSQNKMTFIARIWAIYVLYFLLFSLHYNIYLEWNDLTGKMIQGLLVLALLFLGGLAYFRRYDKGLKGVFVRRRRRRRPAKTR